MNKKLQRIKIAEACGKLTKTYFYEDKSGDRCIGNREGKHGTYVHDLLEYPSDLNAMHEAEKVLTDEQWEHYRAILYTLTPKFFALPDCERSNIHAKAAQRAEAFLKTLGLWEEGE